MIDRLTMRRRRMHRLRCGLPSRFFRRLPPGWAVVAHAVVAVDTGRLLSLPHFHRGRRQEPRRAGWHGCVPDEGRPASLHLWRVHRAREIAQALMAGPLVELSGLRLRRVAWLHEGPRGRRLTVSRWRSP